MKPHSTKFLTARKALVLLSVAALFLLTAHTRLSAGKFRQRSPAAANYESRPANAAFTVLWHAGNFRYLDATTDDLLTFVGGLQHPNSGGYGKLSSTRKTNFNAFLDALFIAIDDSLADGSTGDWCGVKTKAATAGYAVRRFYDTDSGRWFVYAYDTTAYGQAYFFINPFAKRNIVIEVPHEPYDANTQIQGARLFKALAARALIINKEHRCSDPDATGCNVGSTSACSGYIRESDVAHQPDNSFHLLHVRYNDMDSVTKFVQLHGFEGAHSEVAVIGDSTTNDYNLSSVSVTFANNLDGYVPTPSAVDSCQQYSGDPDPSYCGEANVQGRYTNNPSGNACSTFTSSYSGRFLHIEQAATLRDDDNSDGWYWGDIRDALLDTWPACNMNNGATDCTLGSSQTQYSTLTCP
jgi:hypothetical protein